MCGILGSVGLAITHKDLNTLRDRGPDGNGIEKVELITQSVWLAHTRLSILDLSSAGHQPMKSKNGRWWISFNGEIYNHLDLRKSLSGPFRGHSDTETLVELIALFGIDKTLPELNGMFAFAALDTQEGKLYLARDPFGIKPLYYVQSTEVFAFASEVRALRSLGIVDRDVDAEALNTFLTLRYTPSPYTLWKNVKRLPAGHYLSLDIASGKVQLTRFVQPTQTHFTGSLEEATQGYQRAFKVAVQRQLLSDVPVGILLSGGIDSALVAAMAREGGQHLPCFTVGFGKNYPECEISDAAETARVLGLPFRSIEVTPEQLREVLPQIVAAIEEPLGTTSILPMWYLVQAAKKDVTVVLTGQGTDEPWGGYRRYQVELLRSVLPSPLFWQLCALGGQMWSSKPEFLERGLRALPVVDRAMRFIEAYALFSAQERRLLTGQESHGRAGEGIIDWLSWLKASDCQPAERMMRLDTRMNLSDDLLLYGDKLSMSVSLEARVPMLDIELVRFVESLPLAYRVQLGRTKIVHKKMAESYLPTAIVHRKKKGFQVPFGDWVRGPWREWVESVLLDQNAPHLKMIDRKEIDSLWRQHVQSKRDRSRQIFALLMLALWWRDF